MGKKVYVQNDSGIHNISGEKIWEVSIPASIMDLWLPIIGLDGIGFVYIIHRLAEDKVVDKMSIGQIAKIARKDTRTIKKMSKLLADFGFWEFTEAQLEDGTWGTPKWIINDIPDHINQSVIEEHRPDDYQSPTWWLIASEEEYKKIQEAAPSEKFSEEETTDDEGVLSDNKRGIVEEQDNLSLVSSNKRYEESQSDSSSDSGHFDAKSYLRKQRRQAAKRAGSSRNRAYEPESNKSRHLISDLHLNHPARVAADMLEREFGKKISHITQKQLEELKEQIEHGSRMIASPMELMSQYPKEYREYIEADVARQLRDIKGLRPTMGSIVRILTTHRKPLIWFMTQRGKQIVPETPEERSRRIEEQKRHQELEENPRPWAGEVPEGTDFEFEKSLGLDVT